jgi:hypothetical protein
VEIDVLEIFAEAQERFHGIPWELGVLAFSNRPHQHTGSRRPSTTPRESPRGVSLSLTPSQIAVIRSSREPTHVLATRYGVCPKTILRYRGPIQRRLTPEQENEIRRDTTSRTKDLVLKYKIGRDAIIRLRGAVRRGGSGHKGPVKVTPQQREEIRCSSLPRKQLAEKYDMSVQSITRIRRMFK